MAESSSCAVRGRRCARLLTVPRTSSNDTGRRSRAARGQLLSPLPRPRPRMAPSAPDMPNKVCRCAGASVDERARQTRRCCRSTGSPNRNLPLARPPVSALPVAACCACGDCYGCSPADMMGELQCVAICKADAAVEARLPTLAGSGCRGCRIL